MKRDVFYLVSKWDHNLVFNSRHLLIHLDLISTLSQLLIVSPAKISEFISQKILQAHGYSLLHWSLVDDASSTRDLGTRLGWVLAKRKDEHPAILTEQAWSIKDLFNGQKGIFFSCRNTGGNPERARWSRQPIRTQDPLQYKLSASFTYWLCRCRVGDWVNVVPNCTMGWSCGTQFCVASVLICNKEAISVPRKKKTYLILLSAFLSSSVCSFNFSSSYIGRKEHS